MELRYYQSECLEALWKRLFAHHNALCVLPTAGGKTLIFIELIKRAIALKPDIVIVILVERIQLLAQTRSRVSDSITSDCITITTIQSVHKLNLAKANLIILDETQHLDQDSGRYINFIKQESMKNPRLKVVGFTATPWRSDGYIYGKNKLFESVTYTKDMVELIAEGYLVTPRLKHSKEEFDVSGLRVRYGEYRQEDIDNLVSNEAKVKRQIEDAIPRLEGRKKIVWVCGNINHAELVKKNLILLKEQAETVHSKQSKIDRAEAMLNFEVLFSRHLTSVSVLVEGWDYPPVDAIVLMRPMRSSVLYVQVCGRGLRPSEGKTDCLVLDYGNVVANLGPLNRPIVPRKGQRKLPTPGLKYCPDCAEFIDYSLRVCPVCEHEFFQLSKDPVKNLTQRATTNGEILSSNKLKTFTVDVSHCRLSKFLSKNNNLCLRVTYYSKDFLASPYHEYFVWSAQYARKKATDRLNDLVASLYDDLDRQILEPIIKHPKRILVKHDGKYNVVQKVEYV